MNPKYSIIIPAYNAEKTIENTINSVINQSYCNWEIVVVENGSIDSTNSVVGKFLNDKRISLIHSKKGVSFARNKGIENSTGEWILFLDADDELPSNTLDLYNNVIDHNNVDIIVGQYESGDGNLEIIYNKDEYICRCLNNPTKECNVTGLVFKSNIIKKTNIEFDVNLTHAEDSLFFLQALLNAKNIIVINDIVYKVNYVNNSSVRSINENQFDSYLSTIHEIYKINVFSKRVYDELPSFVLNQVLIVLVNNIFSVDNDKSIFSLLKYEKKILNEQIVRESLDNITFKYCDKKRKLLFHLMQKHRYYLLGLICRQKSSMNKRKG